MVMTGGLTNRIYAVRRYTERGNGMYVAATNGKDDVTQQALRAAIQHVDAGCEDRDCECQYLTLRRECGFIRPIPEPGKTVKACILHPRHAGLHSNFEYDW